MSSSTSRKRRKPTPKTQNSTITATANPSQSPSSSTLTSLLSEVEPPPNVLPSKSDFLKLILIIIIAASIATFCSFIFTLFNRTSKPFCDSDFSDYYVSISDLCEPCPSHGRCFNGLLECNPGYRKYRKLCIEDGDIYEAVKKLSGWAKGHLCEAHAHYMCYGVGAIWVSEGNLKNLLDKQRVLQGSTDDEIIHVFTKERAMEDINELLDSRTNLNGVKEFKCPDILAESYRPLTCCVRQWMAKNLLLLLAVFGLLAGCIALVFKFRRKWYLTRRAEHLYHQVCDILEDNALMSQSMGDKEPWLIASRLQDHLLTPKERKDPLLWKMVEKLVEFDSRLGRYPKLVKGEPKVVWEWQVEDF